MIQFDEKFWLAFSFVVFITLIYKPVKGFILNYLDRQITELNAKIQEAAKLKKNSELLLEQSRKNITEISNEYQSRLNEARENISQLITRKERLLEQELEQKYGDAINRIERQKEQVIVALKSEFIEVSHQLIDSYLEDHPEDLPKDKHITETLINKVEQFN